MAPLTHKERGQRNRGKTQITVQKGGAEMTFTEIAAVLGSNKKCVFMAYKTGMAKIRRDSSALAALEELVAYRSAMRANADLVEVKR